MSPRSRAVARGAFRGLTAPFRSDFWWWDAVIMSRRLAFSVNMLLSRQHLFARSVANVAMALLALATHAHTKPFTTHRINVLETGALLALNAVAAASLVDAFQRLHGLTGSHAPSASTR